MAAITASTTSTVNSYSDSSTEAGSGVSWTVNFKTSATGALTASSTISVTFPAGITLPSTYTIVPSLTGFSGTCAPTDSVVGQVVTVTLGGTCTLAASTTASLTLAGIANPAASTINYSSFSFATSSDPTAATLASGSVTTVTPSPSAPTQVTFIPTTPAVGVPTSYDVGFTPSAASTGTPTVTINFASGIAVPGSTTVTAVSGLSGGGSCAPTAVVAGQTVTVTLTGCSFTASAVVIALSGFTNAATVQSYAYSGFSLKTSADSTTNNSTNNVVLTAQFPAIPVSSFPGTISEPGLARTIVFPVAQYADGIATDGKVFFVSGLTGTSVYGYSVTTGTLVDTINTGVTDTLGIAMDPSHLWVVSWGSDALAEYALAGANDTPTFVKDIALPDAGNPYDVCDDGTNVWVTNQTQPYIYEVNVATGVLVNTLNIGTDGNQIACDGTTCGLRLLLVR